VILGTTTHQRPPRRAGLFCARTGARLEHLSRYSFDPSILPGNIEQFTGVAQVPIGIAGPLLVNGERAGRVLCSAGDDRGHPGRKLQPGDENAV
jgi:Hydroxymethylglutaryl-coenzyme A reductase